MFPSLGAKDRNFWTHSTKSGRGLSLAPGDGSTGDRRNEVGRMRQILQNDCEIEPMRCFSDGVLQLSSFKCIECRMTEGLHNYGTS